MPDAIYPEQTADFIAAANPRTVLSLITEIESLKADLQTYMDIANREANLAESLRKQLEEAGTRINDLDEALTDALFDRDKAQDALLDASLTMGGPEWCAKIPPEPAPDSGDLHEDVPELCRLLVEERDSLRSSRAGEIERAIRLTVDEYRNQAMAYPGANVGRVLPVVLAQLKEQK